ncbi:hypothetical protein [Bradyrhizobium sp. th.b2]|uniref:hypothetical protein n=1 Tax=Bradyrhizobium sp. th-b2 TaxID=172088 RepID=UPI00048C08D1|nr:hypothetical protein [Bradyrhizobium sp. th.b2]
MKKLIVFDLDGTIAESKSSLDDEMSALLRDLLSIVRAAVISGGNWPQFEKQLVSNLPRDAKISRTYLSSRQTKRVIEAILACLDSKRAPVSRRDE